MLEWLSLNDIQRILRSYRYEDSYTSVSILSTLNRLIATLELIIVLCTLMISILPSNQETDRSIVDVSRINFVNIGRVNAPKLVFFDDRDEIT